MEVDLAYYRKRSAEEAAAAEVALNPNVRAIHLELKRCYDERASAIVAARADAGLHLVSVA